MKCTKNYEYRAKPKGLAEKEITKQDDINHIII